MRQRKTKAMVVGTAVLALAPKCPFCLLAFFGVVGVASVPGSAYRVALLPVTAIWLTLTVAMLAFQSAGPRRFATGFVGLVGASAVFAGKFILNDQALIYAGIAALLGTAIWIVWFQTPTSSGLCKKCERTPLSHD